MKSPTSGVNPLTVTLSIHICAYRAQLDAGQSSLHRLQSDRLLFSLLNPPPSCTPTLEDSGFVTAVQNHHRRPDPETFTHAYTLTRNSMKGILHKPADEAGAAAPAIMIGLFVAFGGILYGYDQVIRSYWEHGTDESDMTPAPSTVSLRCLTLRTSSRKGIKMRTASLV